MSHQNVTQNKTRKANVPPDPAVLIDAWSDCPPPGVGFGIVASLSYRSVQVPHSLLHTDSRCVTLVVVDLSNPQGQGGAVAVSTPPHASLTPAPPDFVHTHLVTVWPAPHASASGLSGLSTFGCPDCNDTAPVETANGGTQVLEPTTPSLPQSLSDLTHIHSTQLSQLFGQPSQSL
jgi:hypothetical protein